MTHNSIRFSALVIAVFVIITSTICLDAFATENSVHYSVPDIPMTIDIPSSTAVISNMVKRNDELFDNGTFDYITAMTKMREDNAVLYGSDPAGYEIEVISIAAENGVKNLSKLSEQKQNKLFEEYKAQPDIVEADTYTNKSGKFFYFSRTLNNGSGRYFFSDYYTVFNGTQLTVRIISENDNLTKAEKDLLKSMVDSIVFPQKKSFSFSTMNGKSVFVTFIVVMLLFALIIVYRRSEEKYNSMLVNLLKKLDKNTDKSQSQEKTTESSLSPALSAPDDSLSETTDSDQNEEEDDLSSIDLDEAIAAFDESIK